MRLDCLYELFVTHLGILGCGLLKATSAETYDNYFQLDCGRLKIIALLHASNVGINSSVEYFQ